MRRTTAPPKLFVDQIRNAATKQFNGPQEVLQTIKASKEARRKDQTLLQDRTGLLGGGTGCQPGPRFCPMLRDAGLSMVIGTNGSWLQ